MINATSTVGCIFWPESVHAAAHIQSVQSRPETSSLWIWSKSTYCIEIQRKSWHRRNRRHYIPDKLQHRTEQVLHWYCSFLWWVWHLNCRNNKTIISRAAGCRDIIPLLQIWKTFRETKLIPVWWCSAWRRGLNPVKTPPVQTSPILSNKSVSTARSLLSFYSFFFF